MSVKSPSDPQLAAKRSVYLSRLSRWLTNNVIILHSSSSKVVKSVWMLAFTRASPSAFPMILHSKGRITYLPSCNEILGSQTILLTWTSPLIAIVLEQVQVLSIQLYGVGKNPAVPWHSEESLTPLEPWIFFFARRPIGPCNLVLLVHHRLMRGEKSVHDSRIGAEPFVHCETWDFLVQIWKSKTWIMEEQQQRKTRAGPARNPGTPRPGARRHGKRNTQPTNNMIQSFNSKTIYTRLPHAVTCCIKTRSTNFYLRMCRCETLLRYSHW